MSIINKYPEYEATIGIEVHTQLNTESKIFCSCPNKFGSKPNTNICNICTGQPGTLPSLNKKVVDLAILTGLATNCQINQVSCFSRKHYVYPDTPKNYQITQGDKPICKNGYLEIELKNEKTKKIRIQRIHIEEDAGKTIHTNPGETLVDLNRSGTPLLEIVTYPDLSSAQEAKSYLMLLRSILQYINVSNANMEEGSFRADVNISVKKKIDKKLGTRVELKNINSFKFIVQAIEYEIENQIKKLQSGKKIIQQTKQWDTKKHLTIAMRNKEESQDYEYFNDPDMPLLVVNDKWIENIKKEIPELPSEKSKRLQNTYKIGKYESQILVEDIELANFFEKSAKLSALPQQTANWILRNVLAFLKENKLKLSNSKFTPENFAILIKKINDKTINSKVAQEVFDQMAKTGKNPTEVIKEKGLEQINSIKDLKKIVLQVIEQFPEQKEKYLGGKENLFMFFVGQTMKKTKGRGNPKIIQDLCKKLLH